MNRQQRRLSEKEGKRLQKLSWNNFSDVTYEAIIKAKALNPTSTYRPDKVYQNNKYIVLCFFRNKQIYGKIADKIMIRRSDSQAIYSWSDIQRIKNEIFGEDTEAIQFFPKQSELIDQANLYWIWILK